jgi:hypothetical protein
MLRVARRNAGLEISETADIEKEPAETPAFFFGDTLISQSSMQASGR